MKIEKIHAALCLSVIILCFPFLVVAAPQVPVEAKDLTEKATKLIDSWNGRTDVLEQSRQYLEQALRIQPKYPLALKELARYFLKSGYINSKSIESPEKLYYTIANVQPGTFEKAESLLKQAISIDPDFPDSYVLLGYVYLEQLKFHESQLALTKAESLGTKDLWLQMNMAELLLATGHEELAAQRYQKVIDNKTDNTSALTKAYSMLIEHEVRHKHYQKVHSLYKNIFALDPNNAWARGNYSDFLRQELGDFDGAVFYARQALKIMDYGVGERILAYGLYGKWADLIVNKKQSPTTAQIYFKEAQGIWPDLNDVMAYEGAYATQTALVQLLKTKGISIDATAEDGSTALIIASNRGRIDAVKTLLSLGANPNARANNGWTALFGAADDGYLDITKLLLQKGADPKTKFSGIDAATWARQKGNIEVFNFILHAGG